MNYLIINFDALNPLAHEWAHILSSRDNVEVTLVNHRETLECNASRILNIPLSHLKLKDRMPVDVIFLPWLPARKNILFLALFWFRNKRPLICWIDHNPTKGREKEGMILRFARRVKYRNIIRLFHSGYISEDKNYLEIPHPIYSHFSENLSNIKVTKSAKLTFAFIGRLDSQKGFDKLPFIAEKLLQAHKKSIKLIIAGNNPNQEFVIKVTKEIESMPNIELEVHSYGKNCPAEIIYEALCKSDFLVAPYKHITASGTLALAMACMTSVIVFGNSYPLGLSDFLGKSIFLVDDSDIKSLSAIINKENVLVNHDLNEIVQAHNKKCEKQLIEIVNRFMLKKGR